MTATIHLASDFRMPLEAATRTFAVLGQKGSGKTTTAVVMVEELLLQSVPVVVIDPTGAWWGLRSGRDGKREGFAITVLGGDHGDLPLEPTAGAVIADLVAGEHMSLVLDLESFTVAEQHRFVTAFAERLYERNKDPVHLVIDEADEFIPQRSIKGEETKMVGALDRLVRRGRKKGVGVSLISQRAAALHKNVLTQVDMLIAMRTTGMQDINTIDEWMTRNGTHEQRTELLRTLESLPNGHAWVWSPGWLRTFRKIAVRDRTTFDSSATPKVGAKLVVPKKLAEVDLVRIRERMAATIERAKADDPKSLRVKIANLEHELASRPQTKTERVEVPVFDKKTLERTYDLLMVIREQVDVVFKANVEMRKMAEDAIARFGAMTASSSTSSKAKAPTAAAGIQHRATARPDEDKDNAKLGGGQRKILNVLAQYSAGRTIRQIAVLAGYSWKGGGFRNYLGELRREGLIHGDQACFTITDKGRDALGRFDPLPTGAALLQYWYSELDKAPRMALEALAKAYPGRMTAVQIAEATGYDAKGGGFRNALGHLRTLELLEGRGDMRASATLFGDE
jgi:hypothetical protein